MSSAAAASSSLAEFIRNRRWFRSKTRNIESAAIKDVIAVPGQTARLLLVELNYAEGDCDNYIVTDRGGDSGQPEEALEDAEFRNAFLRAFEESAAFRGRSGELVFTRTRAFPAGVAGQRLESAVSRAEQSNTSIIFGDQFILKLFRKVEPGINPDVEIGAFLTKHGFTHTPAVFGTLEYRSDKGQIYSAGILQQFVKNRGDAWKYTLQSLSGFFDRATEVSAGSVNEKHLVGDYLQSAALLGQRTAEMHKALGNGGNPDFEPEPFTPDAAQKLYQEMLAQADIAFETLRRKQATLSGEIADAAQKLLHLEHRVTERFSELRNKTVNAARIRFHGDYHLGQVLWTGSDFMIIDFEGEPARPLEERRAKTLAMRDVAGMLRSFQYAAYAGLFQRGSSAAGLERWADAWNEWVSAEYLNAYVTAAEGGIFLSTDAGERRVLLDAFILHKALYEVAYEMNNRPDWVQIPLRGILNLIA